MPGVFVVIPCFNEAERFESEQAAELLSNPDVHLVLVDDGSTDQTWALFETFAASQPEQIRARVVTHRLERNQGKAEAVRQGMLLAIQQGADITGYLDGDFATPAREMLRLINFAAEGQAKAVLAARWLHLGSNIERSLWRHYAGRVFATLASTVLALKVYDTQCGAKLFRVTPALEACLGDRFISKWAFDVELIGRLRHSYEISDFLEMPLQTWVDIAGSKLSFGEMLEATLALWQIYRSLKATDYSNFRGVHQGKNSGIS